jgi:hypothetical protein
VAHAGTGEPQSAISGHWSGKFDTVDHPGALGVGESGGSGLWSTQSDTMDHAGALGVRESGGSRLWSAKSDAVDHAGALGVSEPGRSRLWSTKSEAMDPVTCALEHEFLRGANRFKQGRPYNRSQISNLLGGQTTGFLPMFNGHVVCGCFRRQYNPDAPEILLPGDLARIIEPAELFCRQGFPSRSSFLKTVVIGSIKETSKLKTGLKMQLKLDSTTSLQAGTTSPASSFCGSPG